MTQPPYERDRDAPAPALAPSEPTSIEPPTPSAPGPAFADPAPALPAVAWSTPGPAPEVGAPGLTWADTPSRFVAYVIDSFLVAFLAGIVVVVLGLPQATPGPGQVTGTQGSQAFNAISAVIGGAYFILSWSGGRRATLGQRLFNIQVGNAFDGMALTTSQAVKRWLGLGSFLGVLAIIPSNAVLAAVNVLALIWVLVLLISTVTSPTKQGLHDRIANSAVVRPVGAGTGLAMGCLVLLIGLIVFALLSIVALIFLGSQVSSILSDVGNSV